MKAPLSWIKEYVDPGLDAAQLAERLALTGTEVERISEFGVTAEDGNHDRLVVGQVKVKEKHPDADRLSLCQVDVGAETAQIVCGAANFSQGDKVAVCLPGGILPGGRKLEAAKIRGVESFGMMCSEAELGLASESEGIMVLPADAPVGVRLADYIPVSDQVLELEITPNRPDCLSIYGLAREVAAITASELAPEPAEDTEPEGHDSIEELISVTVVEPGLCPRYGARLIAGVTVATSPPWLKARLLAAGIRPVSNVVDITNYVMWLTGEPMHAFDLKNISGGRLIVRRASAGEKIAVIDGSERTLDESMLVIADAEKPVAIAGIMGGLASEVTGETTDILLEAANFNGRSVLETSMALGLRSESSTRFEKGLDAGLVPGALAQASKMMVELCGGRLLPGQIDVRDKDGKADVVHLRYGQIARVLGIAIPPDEADAILERLGFGVEREGEGARVTIPGFRADVGREIDLIEEVARVFGLDLIPPSLPSEMRVMGGLSGRQQAARSVVRTLTGSGLDEVITYTFIAPDFADRLRLADGDLRRPSLSLANPLSIEQSVMRTLMLPGLLETVAGNLSLRHQDVNIFERGHVYAAGDGELPAGERTVIGGCLCGSLKEESWRGESPAVDFFTARGLAEAAFGTVGGSFELMRAQEPFLHPGKSARVLADGRDAGYIGEVHPLVLEAFDIDRPVMAFELDEEALMESSRGVSIFKDIITYPSSSQDLAVVVDEAVSSGDVVAAVREAGAPLLDDVRIFDTYTGDQVGAGKKSIALRLEFRSPERTLTDEDVDAVRQQIVSALADRLGAALRA